MVDLSKNPAYKKYMEYKIAESNSKYKIAESNSKSIGIPSSPSTPIRRSESDIVEQAKKIDMMQKSNSIIDQRINDLNVEMQKERNRFESKTNKTASDLELRQNTNYGKLESKLNVFLAQKARNEQEIESKKNQILQNSSDTLQQEKSINFAKVTGENPFERNRSVESKLTVKTTRGEDSKISFQGKTYNSAQEAAKARDDFNTYARDYDKTVKENPDKYKEDPVKFKEQFDKGYANRLEISNTTVTKFNNNVPVTEKTPTIKSVMLDNTTAPTQTKEFFRAGSSVGDVETYTRKNVTISRGNKPISPSSEEGKTIQAIYDQQSKTWAENQAQQEYFWALTRGEVPIGKALYDPETKQSFINKKTNEITSVDPKLNERKQLTQTYLEERGMSLDTPMAMVKLSPTKYFEARQAVRDSSLTGKPMGDLRDYAPNTIFQKPSVKAYTVDPAVRANELESYANAQFRTFVADGSVGAGSGMVFFPTKDNINPEMSMSNNTDPEKNISDFIKNAESTGVLRINYWGADENNKKSVSIKNAERVLLSELKTQGSISYGYTPTDMKQWIDDRSKFFKYRAEQIKSGAVTMSFTDKSGNIITAPIKSSYDEFKNAYSTGAVSYQAYVPTMVDYLNETNAENFKILNDPKSNIIEKAGAWAKINLNPKSILQNTMLHSYEKIRNPKFDNTPDEFFATLALEGTSLIASLSNLHNSAGKIQFPESTTTTPSTKWYDVKQKPSPPTPPTPSKNLKSITENMSVFTVKKYDYVIPQTYTSSLIDAALKGEDIGKASDKFISEYGIVPAAGGVLATGAGLVSNVFKQASVKLPAVIMGNTAFKNTDSVITNVIKLRVDAKGDVVWRVRYYSKTDPTKVLESIITTNVPSQYIGVALRGTSKPLIGFSKSEDGWKLGFGMPNAKKVDLSRVYPFEDMWFSNLKDTTRKFLSQSDVLGDLNKRGVFSDDDINAITLLEKNAELAKQATRFNTIGKIKNLLQRNSVNNEAAKIIEESKSYPNWKKATEDVVKSLDEVMGENKFFKFTNEINKPVIEVYGGTVRSQLTGILTSDLDIQAKNEKQMTILLRQLMKKIDKNLNPRNQKIVFQIQPEKATAKNVPLTSNDEWYLMRGGGYTKDPTKAYNLGGYLTIERTIDNQILDFSKLSISKEIEYAKMSRGGVLDLATMKQVTENLNFKGFIALNRKTGERILFKISDDLMKQPKFVDKLGSVKLKSFDDFPDDSKVMEILVPPPDSYNMYGKAVFGSSFFSPSDILEQKSSSKNIRSFQIPKQQLAQIQALSMWKSGLSDEGLSGLKVSPRASRVKDIVNAIILNENIGAVLKTAKGKKQFDVQRLGDEYLANAKAMEDFYSRFVPNLSQQISLAKAKGIKQSTSSSQIPKASTNNLQTASQLALTSTSNIPKINSGQTQQTPTPIVSIGLSPSFTTMSRNTPFSINTLRLNSQIENLNKLSRSSALNSVKSSSSSLSSNISFSKLSSPSSSLSFSSGSKSSLSSSSSFSRFSSSSLFSNLSSSSLFSSRSSSGSSSSSSRSSSSSSGSSSGSSSSSSSSSSSGSSSSSSSGSSSGSFSSSFSSSSTTGFTGFLYNDFPFGGSNKRRRKKAPKRKLKTILWEVPSWWGGYYEPVEYRVVKGMKLPKKFNYFD